MAEIVAKICTNLHGCPHTRKETTKMKELEACTAALDCKTAVKDVTNEGDWIVLDQNQHIGIRAHESRSSVNSS